MASASSVETEIKLRVPDPASARGLIERNGFSVSVERVFESNVIYDTADTAFRRRGELVRIRTIRPAAGQAGDGRSTLTFKGAAVPGRHKIRPELETSLSDAAPLETVFDRAGLGPVFRYEKYRTEYRRKGGDGVVTLDETPIGAFLELEGSPAWIDETARELGFKDSDYVLSSYAALYFEYCRERGVQPSGMVFPPA